MLANTMGKAEDVDCTDSCNVKIIQGLSAGDACMIHENKALYKSHSFRIF